MRKVGKKFLQRKPDPTTPGGWIWSVKGERLVPYRLPELLSADPAATVYICEGERDVDTAIGLGLVATCNPMGAGKFSAVAELAANLLRGRLVVVVADADEPGRRHAADVQRSLAGAAKSVRVVECPDSHKDLSDWVAAGASAADIAAHCARAVEPTPAQEQARPLIEWIDTSGIFAPLPPTPWRVRDLHICPGRPGVFGAFGGTGKSIVAQSLALAYAAGRSAWGHFSTGRGGRVRHVDKEQGRHATLKRYQRLALGMGLSPADLEGNLQVAILPPMSLTSEGAEDALCREFEGVELGLFDAFRGMVPGVDENDSRVREYLDICTRVSERIGTAFVFLHHSGKSGADDEKKDKRQKLRGSSGIFDASGAVFLLEVVGDGLMVTETKPPAEAEGAKIAPFGLRIEDVAEGENPHAGLRVVYVAEESLRPQKAPGSDFEGLKDKIVELLRVDHSLTSKNKVAARVKGTRTDKLQAIDELIEERRIAQVGGEGGCFRVV